MKPAITGMRLAKPLLPAWPAMRGTSNMPIPLGRLTTRQQARGSWSTWRRGAQMIHVCSLARLHDTVRETGARHVVTLIKDITLVHRPPSIAPENHLLLDMDDIAEPIEGYVAPAEEHVGDLIRFVRAWPRTATLVVRC